MPRFIQRHFGRFPAIYFSLTLCFAALPLSAAENEQTIERGNKVMDEMIVSAQKKDESIQDVAISIKALSEDTLEKLGVENMGDVAMLVPSLSTSGQRRGANNIQIRGLGSNVGVSAGTVAIYNDGIISSASLAGRGGQFEQDASLYDLGRVEVLRGPQGTLYGQGSFGGVINFFSKRPNAENLEASVSLTVSDTKGAGDLNNSVNASLNVPLIKDVLAVRAAGTFLDESGYIDAFSGFGPAATLFIADANYAKIWGGRFSIRFTPTDTFDATLILKAEKAELGLGGTDSPNLLARYESQVNPSNAGPSEIETNEAILEINYHTPFGTLTSVSGYTESENTEFLLPDTQFRPAKSFSEELRFSSDHTGALNWTAGVYYREAEGVFKILLPTTLFPAADFKQDQWSVFGQLYWDIISSLRVTLGARYGQQDAELVDGFPLRVSGGTAVRRQASFDNFSPKIALDWHIGETTLVYASYAKGFRAGGFNLDQSSSLAADPAFVLEFESDKVFNYELGLKTEFWDDRVIFNSAVFYIDWTDTLVEQFLPASSQNIAVNAGDAHSAGFETDIIIAPADGWLITLGGALIQAEMDSGIGSSGDPLRGDRLPLGPRYTLNTSIEKTFEIAPVDAELYMRADYSLRDGSYADVPNDPTLLGAAPGSTYLSSSVDILNVRSGLRSDSWEVQLFVNNLLDEYGGGYNLFAFGLELHSVAQPRTVGATLKYRFSNL